MRGVMWRGVAGGWAVGCALVGAALAILGVRIAAAQETFLEPLRPQRERGLMVAQREEPGGLPTFSGLFADGTDFHDSSLADWHERSATPKCHSKPLWDAKPPLRWIRNESLRPGGAGSAFVEMFGGDRFCGEVKRFVTGDESLYDRQPPHLLIIPAGDVFLSGRERAEELPLLTRWVRRIVWQRRGPDAYSPGTLWYRDGRRVAFRKVRLVGERLLLLVESGPLEAAIEDVAELHLPRSDSWQAHWEQLAILSPEATERLVTLETDGGLRVTTSQGRYVPGNRGSRNDPRTWLHLVQPAWSLRPFWVSVARVHTWTFFAPHEVPLSHLEPLAIDQQAVTGRGWPVQWDRNVRGQFLASGERDHAWGLGMHAPAQVTFPLTEGVTALTGHVGLDKLAGSGGCARAKVFANTLAGSPLYESPHLIGSSKTIDIGRVKLDGPAKGQNALLLTADTAHADRPAGADPLDIRDLVDWLEPLLEVDPLAAQRALRGHWTWALPGWEGWTLENALDVESPIRSRWEDRDSSAPRCNTELCPGPKSLVLRTTQRIEPTAQWLLLGVGQTNPGIFREPTQPPKEQDTPPDKHTAKPKDSPKDSPKKPAKKKDAPQEYIVPSVFGPPAKIPRGGSIPNRIVVRIDGKPVAEFDAPQESYRGRIPDPLLVPLAAYRGQQVQLEIEQLPGGSEGRVAWHALGVVDSLTRTRWTTLTPVRVKSADGAVPTIVPDGSVHVSGRKCERDLYTVVTQTNLRGITALRLEALADPALPQNGPGRSSTGSFLLSEFRVTAAPPGQETDAKPVRLMKPWADYQEGDQGIGRALDGNSATGWGIGNNVSGGHVAIFEVDADPTLAAGTLLTFYLDQQAGGQLALGRLRLSATTDPLPLPTERLGRIVRPPSTVTESAGVPIRRRVLDDDAEFPRAFTLNRKLARLEPGDRFAGSSSLWIGRGEAGGEKLPKLGIVIREQPGPGEFRYIRWAWKKRGGEQIGLELVADGKRVAADAPATASRKYVTSRADAGRPDAAAGIAVHEGVPTDWVVVTRDLFADWGAVTLTGIVFHAPDGEGALFDRLEIARTLEDWSRISP